MTSTQPRAKEAAWYDDFYRTVQLMGPWYYFMIPTLRSIISSKTRLLELGCGQGHILRYLVEKDLVARENVYAVDQSTTAVEYVRQRLPGVHLHVGDIYHLEYPSDFFDICLLMETIEHLDEPLPALEGIFRVMKANGSLFVSFPNYLSPPWLPFRLLAELLNKPEWIVLQPIDKIYTVFHVIKMVQRAGFRFEKGIGSGYGPPLLYRWEPEWLTRALNVLKLWRLSFHPILVFNKPGVQPP